MMKIYPLLFSVITITNLYSMQSLHQDDINSPTCWVENPSNPNPVWLPSLPIHNSAITINQRHFYRPATINDVKDLIVCAFIHDQALEQNNNYQEHFAAVKRFATWYATIKHKNLELLSCQYTEPWSDNKQVKAGEQLQNILTQYYPDAETVLFGHSNGANISNYVSRITPAEKPIDLMIHLSCPRQHRDNYQPLHYKNLLYFFSDSDGTETPPIPWAEYFTSHYKLPHGTHDFINLNDKITVGFNTKIDGNEPHTIMNIIPFLPEIIEETLQQYPYHYTGSNGFYLNTCNKIGNNILYIILREKRLENLSHPKVLQFVDYLVRNNNTKNSLDVYSLSRKTMITEGIYNQQIEHQYRSDYGKDISNPILCIANNQLQTDFKPSYFSTIALGTLITLFIALIYKLFFKKHSTTPSENDKENDEESSAKTNEITAADIFNNFVLTTQPL